MDATASAPRARYRQTFIAIVRRRSHVVGRGHLADNRRQVALASGLDDLLADERERYSIRRPGLLVDGYPIDPNNKEQ
jgi:hypothetical protein